MGVIIPVGYSQIAMRWSLAGDSEWMLSTIGVLNLDEDDTPVQTAFKAATAWDASLLTTAGNMSLGWSAGALQVTTMTGSGPVMVELGAAVSGSNAALSLPNNCAALVRKQSSRGGRAGRGRCFLPSAYLPEGTVNQVGTIDPAQVSNIVQWFATFWDGLVDASLLPMLFHSDGDSASQLTGFTVSPKIATQRTRMRR